jgi:tetratricopeptide (TPR) repeat protein
MCVRRFSRGILAFAASLGVVTLTFPARSDSPQLASGSSDKPKAEEIKKLIEQLGNKEFSKRESASKRLETIGKPAVDPLRDAFQKSKDPEVRRRASQLIDAISPDDTMEKLFMEGVRQEIEKKDFKKAVEIFNRVAAVGQKRFHPIFLIAPPGDIPILTDIYLHLAQCHRQLEDYEKAANDFHKAAYYSNFNADKRQQIDREWSEMTDGLLSKWEKTIKGKIDRDPGLKKLAARYPLVVLHTRRYAGGGYLKSAYSFNYETSEEGKHRNDVQILFDNGTHQNTFEVNMVVGQKNRVTDLGRIEFESKTDPNNLVEKGKNPWVDGNCKAVEGHLYLEKVEDSRGNKFLVAFKIVDLDKDGQYLAFLWRRLPGGTVIKQP